MRSRTVRTGPVIASMLLASAVMAAAAPAQSLPSTDALPTGGVEVTPGPNGVNLGIDAGDTGGVNVGAGPGGVNLDLRTTPKQSAPPSESAQPVNTPGGPTSDPRSGSAPRQSPGAAPDSAVTGPRPRSGRNSSADRDGRRSEASGGPADRAAGAIPAVDGLRSAARAEKDDRGGIAPVFDLVERIPAAVRAGLVALALIAIAMWALWVRGRRRLEHNAYLDPDTDVGNMAAFEQVLDREWQRASRYRRPLGLLLLDVEQRGTGGIRLLAERDARRAVEDISGHVRASDTVARLSPSRFAVICPEAPKGSVETLGRSLEHRLEERRLRCRAGAAERNQEDTRPSDLVARAAATLAGVPGEAGFDSEPVREPVFAVEPVVLAGRSGHAAAQTGS